MGHWYLLSYYVSYEMREKARNDNFSDFREIIIRELLMNGAEDMSEPLENVIIFRDTKSSDDNIEERIHYWSEDLKMGEGFRFVIVACLEYDDYEIVVSMDENERLDNSFQLLVERAKEFQARQSQL